ncbi:MAG: hypothetical protein K0S11_1482 [Gammaproteobacteria bacterium]|jgi:hypothetical protein|nr:hypothetical protein [Gammaproteobacteria bacterium]
MQKNKQYYIENVETYIPTLNLKSAKIKEHEFSSKYLAVETGLTQ